MNVSSIYDRSVKMIDESYGRLLKIWSLPNGSISKKNINNHTYYYHQYRDGKKIVTHIIKNNEIEDLRKKISLRKKYEKQNKVALDNIIKNIKVISVFNKDLSLSLHDELFAYRFDEIPLNKREKVNIPFVTSLNERDIKPGLDEYFLRWKNGEIRAREISNFIIQKLSD